MNDSETKLPSDSEAEQSSAGPTAGQDKTAPKADPKDGAAVDDLVRDRQSRMGPK